LKTCKNAIFNRLLGQGGDVSKKGNSRSRLVPRLSWQ
jgi:hypothetical protein